MYPPQFGYFAPPSIDEALKFLEREQESRPLAGGMSLIPMLKFRLIRPTFLVDLNPIKGLSYIKREGEVYRIGALTRYSEALEDAPLTLAIPMLREVLTKVGDIQVRNMGTLGGSLAQADPSGDLPAAAVALDSELVVASTSGERSIKAEEFFKGPFTTALKQGEIIREVRIPIRAGYRWSYVKIVRRAGDFALVSLAAALKLSGNAVDDVRLVYSGVGDRPVREKEAEKVLIGRKLDRDSVEDAISKFTAKPPSDVRGSSELRTHVMKVITRRVLLGVR